MPCRLLLCVLLTAVAACSVFLSTTLPNLHNCSGTAMHGLPACIMHAMLIPSHRAGL